MSSKSGATAWTGVAMLAGVLLAGEARAVPSIVLPRPGQVGVGVQGGFGSLLSSGSLGADYGSGPGITVHVRYRLRFDRAVGVTFEAQSLDARNPRLADTTAFVLQNNVTTRQLNLIFSGVDVYQMFDTRSRTVKMVGAGIGLAQTSLKLSDGEIEYPGDGLYLNATAGVEHYFWRSWAYDLTARYLAVFQQGKVNHDFEANLGVIFYASY